MNANGKNILELKAMLESEYLSNPDTNNLKDIIKIVDTYMAHETIITTNLNELLNSGDFSNLRANLLNSLSAQIKNQRKSRKYTVAQMAKFLGINKNTLYNIENKKHLPNFDSIVEICIKLEIPIEHLSLCW